MIISLELAPDEAAFLEAQLQRHVEHVENELVHAAVIPMQRELASEVARMRELLERLRRATAARAAREEHGASETTMSPEARSGAV